MTEREIGLILAKLDALHEDILEVKVIHMKQDERLDSLERFRSWASGAGALGMALVTGILTFFK